MEKFYFGKLIIWHNSDIFLNSSVLTPHHGFAGKYTRWSDTTCESTFIHGVAIEIYKKGGVLYDARGATNLKMYCKDGTKLETSNNDKRFVLLDKILWYF